MAGGPYSGGGPFTGNGSQASGSSSSGSYPANVYNLTAKNTQYTRRMKSNVRNSVANGRILVIGNSIARGIGSGTTNVSLTGGEIWSKSWPTQLAGLLNSAGINAHANSFSGSGSSFLSNNNAWASIGSGTADTRCTVGSSWSDSPGGVGTLGGAFMGATTSTNAFSFRPTVNVDTFTIWYFVGPGSGTIGFDINGGTQTQVSTNAGGTGISSTTITGTLGNNVLNIKFVSGSSVFFHAISAYDSSKKWIDVMNAGWSGASYTGVGSGNIDNTFSEKSLTYMAPDLTIICGSGNDWILAGNVTTMTTNMQNLITKALVTGDVMLMTDNPSPLALATQNAQQAVVTAMYGLAASNNIPLIDVWQQFGNNSNATADGWGEVFDDTTAGPKAHPSTLGYGVFSNLAFNTLMAV